MFGSAPAQASLDVGAVLLFKGPKGRFRYERGSKKAIGEGLRSARPPASYLPPGSSRLRAARQQQPLGLQRRVGCTGREKKPGSLR